MKQAAILLFSLAAFGSSLKLESSHLAQAPRKFSPQEAKAYDKFINFIEEDKALKDVLLTGKQPDTAQETKILGFMVTDEYFTSGLINAIAATPNNSWLKDLSKDAQARYIRIVASVPLRKVGNDQLVREAVNKLEADSEIGAALKKKYGDKIDAEMFKEFQQSVETASTTVGTTLTPAVTPK